MALTNKHLENKQGIYIIKQISTGKLYVGKSVNVKGRIGQHIKGKATSTSLISKAIQEFGCNDFDVRATYQLQLSQLELVTLEYVMIKRYGSMKPSGFNGYVEDVLT